jgi:hypothetical protein
MPPHRIRNLRFPNLPFPNLFLKGYKFSKNYYLFHYYMGRFGDAIGTLLGGEVGRKFGGERGGKVGEAVGGIAGSLIPFFETGGLVKGKKGKPVKALVHGGEYVLPVGVKPTKAQKKAVAKRKAKKHMKPHK